MSDSFISDETLIGYLLGCLDLSEADRVRARLEEDHSLRIRLANLSELTRPFVEDALGASDDQYEPPVGLSDSTLESIFEVDSHAYDSAAIVPAHLFQTRNSSDVDTPRLDTVRGEMAEGKNRSWADLLAGLTAVVIGFSIISPLIVQSREHARTRHCQSQLRELGFVIRDYAFTRWSHSLPEIEADGPLAFAGMYVIRMHDAGLIGDNPPVWCPGDDSLTGFNFAGLGSRIPSTSELITMPSTVRELWKRVVGGSYAYNLGIIENNQHVTPVLENRSHFAILADAPRTNEWSYRRFVSHRGVASNILYEDGRIQLVRFDNSFDGPDHPYLNHLEQNRAGIDHNDSSLGASYQSPLDVSLVPSR